MVVARGWRCSEPGRAQEGRGNAVRHASRRFAAVTVAAGVSAIALLQAPALGKDAKLVAGH